MNSNAVRATTLPNDTTEPRMPKDAMPPPEAVLSAEQIAQQQRELEEAQNMPLPEDDDDI